MGFYGRVFGTGWNDLMIHRIHLLGLSQDGGTAF